MLSSAQVLTTLEKFPDAALTEAEIARLWQSVVPHLGNLKTVGAEPFRLLESGRVNTGSGPDLVGARVELGGVRKTGAVEIHRQPAGWYHHDHHEDPAFNRVILHLCFTAAGKCPTRRHDGVIVPQIILENHLEEIRKLTRRPTAAAQFRRLRAVKHRCYRPNRNCQQIRRRLEQAGRCWLYHRAARLQQLRRGKRIFQPLVAALGYTYNHRQFRALGRRLEPNNFREVLGGNLTPVQLESWLLGRGGWLRGQFSRAVNRPLYRRRRCWREEWTETDSLVRVDDFWRHGKVRPQAYPCRRWLWFGRATRQLDCGWRRWVLNQANAALASEDFRGQLSSAFAELFSFPAQSYWRHHYTFSDDRKQAVPAPVGPAWIDQVIVNVVLPGLFAAAMLAGDRARRAAVEQAFVEYPPVLGNRRTRRFCEQLGSEDYEWPGVAHQQGATFIYKRFCRGGDCEECPFARNRSGQLNFSFKF